MNSRLTLIFLRISTAVIFGAAVLAWFARFHWVFDVFTHFQIQYFSGGLILLILAFFAREWVCTVLCAVLMLNAASHMNFGREGVSKTAEPVITVMQFNRLYVSRRFDPLVNYLEGMDSKPDVITVQEIDPESSSFLTKSLKALYPHWYPKKRLPGADVLILSRLPILTAGTIAVGKQNLSTGLHITVKPTELDRTVTIYSIHAKTPTRDWMLRQRNKQLLDMARVIGRDDSKYRIFMGDWNITAFDPYFRDVLALSRLKNRYQGLFPPSTWPSVFYLPFLKIPIDQILSSDGLVLTEKHAGPFLYSDHNPLIARFATKPPPSIQAVLPDQPVAPELKR